MEVERVGLDAQEIGVLEHQLDSGVEGDPAQSGVHLGAEVGRRGCTELRLLSPSLKLFTKLVSFLARSGGMMVVGTPLDAGGSPVVDGDGGVLERLCSHEVPAGSLSGVNENVGGLTWREEQSAGGKLNHFYFAVLHPTVSWIKQLIQKMNNIMISLDWYHSSPVCQ
ncbi:hypothetical protein EJ110_NYTH59652 [Nymphaea thermarum]|nr:hypothetical protein EJ110_NYTH59652 [Nymphaea thermarum]